MTEEQATKKKGLGPLAWIAIGCGGLIIIAFIVMSAGVWFAGKKIKEVADDFEDNPAKAAAEMIVKVNPDLELVESDDSDGTITVRQKSTGEVATFDYSEIEQGKLGFESGEGKMTFDATGDQEGGVFTVETEEGTARWGVGEGVGETPDWFPQYPGATIATAGYAAEMDGTASGSFTLTTADSPASVIDWYRNAFESAGFEVDDNTMSSSGEVTGGMLTADSEAEQIEVQMTIGRQADTTQATIFFTDAP